MRLNVDYLEDKENPYIKINKIFYSSEKYKDLKPWDREIYSILRDRWRLSLKNKDKYTNSDGEIYFKIEQKEISEQINMSKDTVMNSIKTLIDLNLVEKVKTSKGNIYFLHEFEEFVSQVAENDLAFLPSGCERLGSTQVAENHLHINKNNLLYFIINIIRINLKEKSENEINMISKEIFQLELKKETVELLLDYIVSVNKDPTYSQIRYLCLKIKREYKKDEEDILVASLQESLASSYKKLVKVKVERNQQDGDREHRKKSRFEELQEKLET